MIVNKENRIRLSMLFVLIILGVLLFFLQIKDLRETMDLSIKVYRESQDNLAKTMFHSLVQTDSKDQKAMVDYINNNFNTSSSSFCILIQNDSVIYIKDENTTASIGKVSLEDLFNSDSVYSRDGEKYILSVAREDNYKYALIVATKQTYLMKMLGLNETILHVVSYFTIYSVMLLIMIAFSLNKIFSLQKAAAEREKMVEKSRLLIEKYESRHYNNSVDSDSVGRASFYTRGVVEQVIESMSMEEKNHCMQVDICVKKLKMEHFILITVILGRIAMKNSVSCYWKDNAFKVLLLHSERTDVENFMDLFIKKYTEETEENVGDLEISAMPLMEYVEGGRS